MSKDKIGRSGVQVEKENEKFPAVCSRSPQNLEFCHLVLLNLANKHQDLREYNA